MKILHLTTQLLSLTLLTAVTSQAYALSCMRPDPVQSCQSMQDEKLNPSVANGVLKLRKVVSQELVPGAIGGKGPAVAESFVYRQHH